MILKTIAIGRGFRFNYNVRRPLKTTIKKDIIRMTFNNIYITYLRKTRNVKHETRVEWTKNKMRNILNK